MGMFAFLAGSAMGVAVYQVYLKQLLQLRWRRWLTSKLVSAWLEDGHHYQLNFIGILWMLSGSLHVAYRGMSFDIPGYMVWAALIYAGIGSIATYFVGKPIVAANVGQNAAEADYRYALVRLCENSEAVAFIRGEADEEKGLTGFFGHVFAATTA